MRPAPDLSPARQRPPTTACSARRGERNRPCHASGWLLGTGTDIGASRRRTPGHIERRPRELRGQHHRTDIDRCHTSSHTQRSNARCIALRKVTGDLRAQR
jgi:hypothetical protein